MAPVNLTKKTIFEDYNLMIKLNNDSKRTRINI